MTRPKSPEVDRSRDRRPHPRRAASAQRLARDLARQAHEEDFKSRRIDYGGDRDRLALANNNPYSDDPTARDAELARFRAWCAVEGIPVLAEATYPTSGPDAGYTHVIVVDIGGVGADVSAAYMGCLRDNHAWWDEWLRCLASTAPQKILDAIDAALDAGAIALATEIATDRDTWATAERAVP